MRSKKMNQKMTLLTLVVALGVAVYLNWEYAKSTDLALDAAEANAPVTTTGVVNVPSVTINGAQEDLHLEQSGSVQQLPVLREVQLVESS